MAAAKKSTTTAKTAAKKTAAKKTTTATKKAATSKSTAKKTAATSTKKSAAKTAAKKTAAKKTAEKTAAAKRASTKKTTAKTATKKTSGKTAAKKTSASSQPSAAALASRKKAASQVTGSTTSSTSTPGLLSNERYEVHEIPAPKGTTKDGISYTKDFDAKFLKAQRDELLARKESEIKRATRLEDEAVSLIEDGEMGDVQFDDEGGEGDTMVVQRDLDRLLSSQARQTVLEIDAALERIEKGTYGYSEVSGSPIPRERLEALPETTVLAAEKASGAGSR